MVVLFVVPGAAYERPASPDAVRRNGENCLFGLVSGGTHRCFFFAGHTEALNAHLASVAKKSTDFQAVWSRRLDFSNLVVLHLGSKKKGDVDVDWTCTLPVGELRVKLQIDIWLGTKFHLDDLQVPDFFDVVSGGEIDDFIVQHRKSKSRNHDHGYEVRKQLESKSAISFLESPLVEVSEYLDFHQIDIELEIVELKAMGIDGSVPITCRVHGSTLANVLGRILDDLRLDYMVKRDVLLITSKRRVEMTPVTHVFSTEGIEMDEEELVSVLRKTVRPTTWIDDSPSSDKTVFGTVQVIPKGLVVRQSPRARDEIAKLLSRLIKVGADQTKEL